MKHFRTKRRKSLVRSTRFTISETDMLFLGVMLFLAVLKCVAFGGVM